MLSVHERGCAQQNVTSLHQERVLRTRELFEALAGCEGGAERSRLLEEVILLNIGVADAIASRYSGRGVALDDLQQVARLALTRVAGTFRTDFGRDFLAYAVPSIKGELKKHFRDAGWSIRPPRALQEAQPAVSAARSRLAQELGREPALDELVAATDLPAAVVREASELGSCFTPDSLDSSLDPESDAPPPREVSATDPGFVAAETRCMLAPALRRLTARDRRVLHLCVVQGISQREIGAEIGVTQAQVSRIVARALTQLRCSLSAPEGTSASWPQALAG